MENVTGHTEPTNMDFEQVDVQILKLQKVGDYFIGKYVDTSMRPYKEIDKKTGELTMKEITQYHFTDVEGKAPFIIFADAGLQNAFLSANVKAGDVVKAVKGEQLPLKSGQKVNTWSLFKAKTTH